MKIAIHWFRRDLRLDDNAALYHALRSGLPVLPLFIFDADILDGLENRQDRRLVFIHQQLENLKITLEQRGSSLLLKHGKVENIWKEILKEYEIGAVFTNHDYEPYAQQRDEKIANILKNNNILFETFKDQCIFEKNEIVKDNGAPYTVFTPYSNKWKQKLNDFYLKPYPTEKYFHQFYPTPPLANISLEMINFKAIAHDFFSKEVSSNVLKNYEKQRDFPALQGTSRLSVHLRFGTISVRQLAKKGFAESEKWLNELIWREFYMMILFHFPYVVSGAFKPQYNRLEWRNNEKEFEAWCSGQTGYPIVDAGMRELNATGYMHNRVRMIAASFLVKDLLVDWRWGEAYFAEKLIDFELSSNNGGWQWAASCGCDAVPYFRIFNPNLQAIKFDTNREYIKRWLPELDSFDYPKPIVEHQFARERVLKVYKSI